MGMEFINLTEEELCDLMYGKAEVDTMYRGIIIDGNDNVTTKEYTNYKDINDAVGGVFSRCGSIGIEIPFQGNVKCDIFCNDEFLISDDEQFDKINAIATLMTNQDIRGNVFILVNEGEDNRGFEYIETPDGEEDICECWMAEDLLMRFITNNREIIEQIHKDFDGNKPEPRFELYDLDDMDKEA